MPELQAAPAAPPELSLLGRLVDEVEVVFHGKREVVRLALTALLARGHILFEDVPGVGKTTLAHALAHASGLGFQRVQFTSDLLPSDVLGVSIYNPGTREFETRKGPIFTHILLADEVNRAPPRTQSGLLQAMQEGTVTIDDHTFTLPDPFLVMATQNPLEHHGTYPLPESQMDRFLMRLTVGYPNREAERQILMEASQVDPVLDRVTPVLEGDQIRTLQQWVERVHADPSLVDYLLEVVERTRTDSRIQLGASPRAAIALFRAARARALVEGRTYLTPDDVRELAVPCLAHRIIPAGTVSSSSDGHQESAHLLGEILSALPVPV